MNLVRRAKKNETGSAFLLAMFLVVVTGFLAISYLVASQQQYRLVDRSQSWNGALPAAEAGVEEAFAHLNWECYSNIINSGQLGWASNSWTYGSWSYTNSDGVTGTAKGLKSPTRYLGSNYYQVTIVTNATTDTSISTKKPEIVAVGYSPTPMRIKGSNYTARQVRVKTQIFFFNSYGIQSLGDIISKGNGITTGAYDPTASTNNIGGVYTNSSQIIAAGSMASVQGNISFSGAGTVYGTVATNPYMTNSTGSQTSIGDMAWVTNGNTGTEPGYYDNSLNTELIDPPFDYSAASSWSVLSPCNCTASYTNVTLVPVQIVTNVYPNPPPAGGVLTNENGLYETATWPSGISESSITTNLITISGSQTLPPASATNIFNLTTNQSSMLFSNVAAAGPPYTSWPAYPTNYVGAVTPVTQVVSNYLSSPPPNQACYPSGSWNYVYVKTNGTDKVDYYAVTTGHGANATTTYYTNYTYTWLQAYLYHTPGSYNWQYYTYSYPTTTYTYWGPKPDTASVTTSTWNYVVTTGSYRTGGDLSLGTMLIQGNVTIYVEGKFTTSGNSKVVIPYGSSLTLYFGGNVDMSGNGGIVNLNERAQSLTMWGLTNCTDVKIAGNASFTGTLYAPEADVTLKGSGKSSFDIVGAITGKTVTVDGKFDVIWPTDLGNSGPMGGFVASKWTEERIGIGP